MSKTQGGADFDNGV